MNRIILLLLFASFLCSLQAQKINSPYDFPIKPGTEEWKKLKSGDEMVDASKLPDSVLISLSTEALAKTSLNYPMLNEVFYASNLQQGIERVIINFNGLTELFKRKDAGAELFRMYKNLKVKDINENANEVQQGVFTLEFTYLELLLSQPQILNNLNNMERNELAKEAIIKYDSKKVRIDIFGEFGLTTPIFLLAKILNVENKLSDVQKSVSPKEIDIFLATAMYSSPFTLSVIYNAGKSL